MEVIHRVFIRDGKGTTPRFPSDPRHNNVECKEVKTLIHNFTCSMS